MKTKLFRQGERRIRHSSDEVNVSANANAVINPLKQKGGFKILKNPIIYLSGILSCLLVPFMSVGCEKPNESVNNNEEGKSSNISIWKCTPDANSTIMLTIDSLQGMVYVHTSPQDLNLNSSENEDKWYLFYDKEEYLLRGDTFLLYKDRDNIYYYNEEYRYFATKLSSDTMKLHFVGILTFGTIPVYITDYLFIRQTIQN